MMFQKFKQDVQRWVVPQEVADSSQVNFLTILKLLFRHASLRAMFWFRFGAWCKTKHIPFIPLFIQKSIRRFHGMDLWIRTDYDGGLYIAHTFGSSIGAVKIGKNCSIIANVTIGMRNDWNFPTIGDNVFIGAGARVLGGIRIGDGAVIGANAVVIKDVPPGATVVGVPARVIRIQDEVHKGPSAEAENRKD